MLTDIYHIKGTELIVEPHEGQEAALYSDARFILVLAGTQSGKTVIGPIWLFNEIVDKGPGDYLVVAPSFPLLSKKVLPTFRKYFEQDLNLGEYKVGEKVFNFYDGQTTVFFGHAQDPDSLESATAKAAWLDEAGQDGFKLESWEAIQRRLSIHQGRALITTTPYNLGWLKTQVYDRWVSGDPDYDVINFRSIDNPAFPADEYHRAEKTLPAWKFALFYKAIFTRPAGLIYDSFDWERHVIEPFEIEKHWPRYGGLDFGGVNTAAVCVAENPDNGTLYLINEYLAGGKTAREHHEALKGWRCSYWAGGAKSEGQWRQEFQATGMPISEPTISEVEVGINRVYGQHKSSGLYVFSTCKRYLDEKGRYARKLDASGQPTEAIQDKETYHIMDAERYIISTLRGDEMWGLA